MDDKQLIDKILENNDQAFSVLVNKYKKLVYGTIYRLVTVRSDVEDIFQDVFIEVYRSIYHLKNENDISGWLFKIAYNKSISFLRKRNPAKTRGYKESEENSMQLENLSDSETPIQKLEQQEANFILFQAIDRLPENQKKALLMHKFEDYSHKEICDVMQLSLSSVESLIYRAKASLRKSLHSYYKKHIK